VCQSRKTSSLARLNAFAFSIDYIDYQDISALAAIASRQISDTLQLAIIQDHLRKA
jgi:hypothetical protein